MAENRPLAVNKTGGVQTEDGRILFGLDAEVYIKIKSKEDPEYQKKVADYIEKVLGEELDPKNDVWQALRTGVTLCKMLNKIKPNVVGNYNTKLFKGKMHPLSERENITKYLEACWKIGVSSADMFIVNDLHSRQGMAAVLNNIAAVSQMALKFGVTVPSIGIKKVDLDKKEAPKFLVREQQSVLVGEIEDDDIEEVEAELHKFTLKLEEAQRTIHQLEISKKNLANSIKLEKQRNIETEKEINLLRSQGPSGDEKFITSLQKQKEKLLGEIAQAKRQFQTDTEKQSLQEEVRRCKERLAALESEDKKQSEPQSTPKENTEQVDLTGLKELRDKISELEKTHSSINDEFDRDKRKILEDIERARKDDAKSKREDEEAIQLTERIKELEESIRKINQEKEQKIKDLEGQFESVNKMTSEEINKIKQAIEITAKEKTEVASQYQQIQDQIEEELSSFRNNSIVELAKLQGEVNQYFSERDLVANDHADLKSKLEKEYENEKNNAYSEVEKVKEKISLINNIKNEITSKMSQAENEIEDSIFNNQIEFEMKIEQLNEEIKKLREDKLEISEKNLEVIQRKEREIFEKESNLKRELESLKFTQAIDSNQGISSQELSQIANLKSELEEAKTQKTMLSQQYREDIKRLLQKNESAFTTIEEQIEQEKTRRDELEEKLKAQKAKYEAEIQKEIAKRTQEAKKFEDSVALLEAEKNELSNKYKEIEDNLDEEIKKQKAEATRNTIKLQNQISEIEAEKNSVVSDIDKLKKNLQAQIQTTSDKSKKEQELLNQKLEQLKKENTEMQKKQKELELGRDSSIIEQKKLNDHFTEETKQLKALFQSMLDQVNTSNENLESDKNILVEERDDLKKRLENAERKRKSEMEEMGNQLSQSLVRQEQLDRELKLGAQAIPPATALKIKSLEVELMEKSTQMQLEIKKLKDRLTKEEPGSEYKKQISDLKSEAEQQKLTIEKLKKEIEEKKKLQQGKPVDKINARRQVRTMRLAPVDPPADLEEDLSSLRDIMFKIMAGEKVPVNELIKFGRTFKLDTGRRTFTFLLKEYVEKMEESHLLIPSSSFDDLKVLIELVLNTIDLRNGADFISGKILLETSSLIARQPKSGEEPEFIQNVIKPHKCWENTFFWQEFFWTSVTPKFSLKHGEGSKAGSWSEDEKEFFEKEIIDFAKVMYGWGDLPLEKLLLFLESLAESCTLGSEARDRVLTGVLQFQTKEQQRIKSGHRKSRLFGTNAPKPQPRMSPSLAPLKETSSAPSSTPVQTTTPTREPSSRPKLAMVAAKTGAMPAAANPTTTTPARPSSTSVNDSKRKLQAKSTIINGEVNDFIANLRRGTVSSASRRPQ